MPQAHVIGTRNYNCTAMQDNSGRNALHLACCCEAEGPCACVFFDHCFDCFRQDPAVSSVLASRCLSRVWVPSCSVEFKVSFRTWCSNRMLTEGSLLRH